MHGSDYQRLNRLCPEPGENKALRVQRVARLPDAAAGQGTIPAADISVGYCRLRTRGSSGSKPGANGSFVRSPAPLRSGRDRRSDLRAEANGQRKAGHADRKAKQRGRPCLLAPSRQRAGPVVARLKTLIVCHVRHCLLPNQSGAKLASALPNVNRPAGTAASLAQATQLAVSVARRSRRYRADGARFRRTIDPPWNRRAGQGIG